MTADIRYISTRGGVPAIPFNEVMLTGLAADGGLYVPDVLAPMPAAEIEALAGQSYRDVAAAVMPHFTGARDLHLEEAYARFAHKAVTPLRQLGDDDWLLELFHGPTLAFKDVAMQWLGPMFADELTKTGRQMTIVAATSGDTGGAAVDAMVGREGIGICVLHPHNRISEVQRRFMTTLAADNVLNLAVQGTFDDCQTHVKAMFADDDFREAVALGAVNSINWARIVAQTIYYVTTAGLLSRGGRAVNYVVPTGNFGDIFAGLIAKRLGAKIGKLIVATNENDILDRCLRSGAYHPDTVTPTQAPSMDIQVSSNFERLIYLTSGGDHGLVADLMGRLKQGGGFDLPEPIRARMAEEFSSYRVSGEEIDARMKSAFEESGELVDPHTAIGLEAAAKARADGLEGPVITLSTAHPAKFPDAVEAATGKRPDLPNHVRALYEREEVFEVVANDLAEIKSIIRGHFAKKS